MSKPYHDAELNKRLAINVMGWKLKPSLTDPEVSVWVGPGVRLTKGENADFCCNPQHCFLLLTEAEKELEGMCVGFWGEFDVNQWLNSERTISFPHWPESYYFKGLLTPFHITTAIGLAFADPGTSKCSEVCKADDIKERVEFLRSARGH